MPLTDREDFNQWVQSPLTAEFLTLLRRHQMDLLEAWGRGRSMTAEEQGKAILLGQLAALRFRRDDCGPGEGSIEELLNANWSEDDG